MAKLEMKLVGSTFDSTRQVAVVTLQGLAADDPVRVQVTFPDLEWNPTQRHFRARDILEAAVNALPASDPTPPGS